MSSSALYIATKNKYSKRWFLVPRYGSSCFVRVYKKRVFQETFWHKSIVFLWERIKWREIKEDDKNAIENADKAQEIKTEEKNEDERNGNKEAQAKKNAIWFKMRISAPWSIDFDEPFMSS